MCVCLPIRGWVEGGGFLNNWCLASALSPSKKGTVKNQVCGKRFLLFVLRMNRFNQTVAAVSFFSYCDVAKRKRFGGKAKSVACVIFFVLKSSILTYFQGYFFFRQKIYNARNLFSYGTVTSYSVASDIMYVSMGYKWEMM